jgi:hypothetical protein
MSQKQEITPWQDESTLRYLYHDKEQSTHKIAELFGIAQKTVIYHMEQHGIDRREQGVPHYSKDELLEWIDAHVEFYGVVPTEEDIIGWPGPSRGTYNTYFGSFITAVRQAGYTPRSER